MNLRAQHFYEPKTSRKYKNKTKTNEPQVPTILIEENDKFYERSTEFLMNLKPQKLDESEAPQNMKLRAPNFYEHKTSQKMNRRAQDVSLRPHKTL